MRVRPHPATPAPATYRSVGSIEDIPEEEFRRNVEINFFGAVNTARAVLPVMRPRRAGHIVNVSSIGGRRAQPGLGAYQASKWALGGFTEILARETAAGLGRGVARAADRRGSCA